MPAFTADPSRVAAAIRTARRTKKRRGEYRARFAVEVHAGNERYVGEFRGVAASDSARARVRHARAFAARSPFPGANAPAPYLDLHAPLDVDGKPLAPEAARSAPYRAFVAEHCAVMREVSREAAAQSVTRPSGAVISAYARLVGMHARFLRTAAAMGLVAPTSGPAQGASGGRAGEPPAAQGPRIVARAASGTLDEDGHFTPDPTFEASLEALLKEGRDAIAEAGESEDESDDDEERSDDAEEPP